MNNYEAQFRQATDMGLKGKTDKDTTGAIIIFVKTRTTRRVRQEPEIRGDQEY